ncbi:hypothetical protein [Vibrio parahaemolyticus]
MRLKNETLRAFYARTVNTQDRKVLYYRDQWRERELNKLAAKSVITVNDVRDLDRFARFKVAVSCFDKCNELCQQYLMQDEHHFVRSAATRRYARKGGAL